MAAILSNDPAASRTTLVNGGPTSAISWSAILLGAVASAVLSLILFLLGTGLGLSSISPWSHDGVSAAAFGISAIIWITVTQAIASGMGGYLTGRLRVRWIDTDPDEVYFRDTAHGFLAWSVATLATATLVTSIIGSIVDTGVQATASLAGGAASAGVMAAAHVANSETSANGSNTSGYFVDALFRPNLNGTVQQDPSSTNNTASRNTMDSPSKPIPTDEVTRIFANSVANGSLSAEDSAYLTQLVAQRTGLTQQEAEARVKEIYATLDKKLNEAATKAKEAADQARKASVGITLWLFVSLLIGAFSASLAATWGGRCRDA
ncbi:MAG TPA: hypothetical protein VK958_08180 [Methylophilus sp.]|uniref:hypothetical protein n=1 Tax=Methylophilus sp. TaxID=29541 RepID=UPI002BA4BCC3|nr:hypothetical protein [Methylophilus sp.]HSH87208.1 hypothetical protein [Methylophilus sp.]